MTKSDDTSWEILKPEIFAAIMDFYSSGQPLLLDSEAAAAKDTAIHEVCFWISVNKWSCFTFVFFNWNLKMNKVFYDVIDIKSNYSWALVRLLLSVKLARIYDIVRCNSYKVTLEVKGEPEIRYM